MAVSAPARQPEVGGAAAQVVALDVGDGRVEAEAAGDLAQALGETGGVEAAGVADDADAALERRPEAVLDLAHEGARVAERGVLHRVLAEDQHGQLGEVVAGEDVERAAVEHLAHRAEAVAVEAGAVADPEHAAHRCALPSPGGPAKACAMPSHRSASSPTATRSVSSRCTRWVASRQKSYAEPVTDCAASSGPHAQVSPDGATQLHAELLGRRLEPVHAEGVVAGAHAEVGDVSHPVGRLGA